ncbi:Ag precursor [Plakobranchus ocellatus]|uniref:Ag n=1 Tax=Plakobranchus ocellatus TaxID=259542 RepID=A0AAV3XTS3_9GAST|nr:Ag precursor [Plakobranchus ocellatus]
MWKLVALLASSLLVTEVSGICEALRSCNQFNRFVGKETVTPEEKLILSYIYANGLYALVDQYPELLDELKDCVDRNLASCELPDVRDAAQADVDLLEYLCSPRGRELTSKLLNSDCIRTGLVRIKLYLASVRCYGNFNHAVDRERSKAYRQGTVYNLSANCTFVELLRQCLVDAAPEVCHDDMTAFIKDVWTHAASKKYERLGCPTQ